MAKKVHLKIKRQDAPDKQTYWEEFAVPFSGNTMNVIEALMSIEENPLTKDGKPTSPVVWDSNCREELCGACSMLINGRAMQACSTLVRKIRTPIVLEPLNKFPVIRDLWVDRSKIFDALRKVKAWNNLDGYFNIGPGPLISKEVREKHRLFSNCISCGSCMEVCPQYNERSPFMGAQALGQVSLFNSQPIGKLNKDERLDAIMGIGGIAECGKSGNCTEICPKEIPLNDAIAKLGRATAVRAFKRFFF